MDMDTDTNATPSAYAQAFQRLEELRADLRRAYGALPAHAKRDLATASELARVSVREAALYMRVMGWSLEAALWHLCRATPR